MTNPRPIRRALTMGLILATASQAARATRNQLRDGIDPHIQYL